MRRENNAGKNFFAGNAGLSGLAASLDSIYKKINAEGLGESTTLELEKDIHAVSERFGVSPKAALLLPAILENNCKNGCNDDDLSEYIGQQEEAARQSIAMLPTLKEEFFRHLLLELFDFSSLIYKEEHLGDCIFLL